MATVTRENIGLLIDKITINVAKEDYMPSFEKALKTYGKQANIPGFRKGMVPPSLIKKMYGSSVLTDEVLRTVEKELTNYMVTEKLDIFAQPLPLPENDARQINIETPADYVFAFEIGLKPGFDLPDLSKASVSRYKITVTDEMVNEEVSRLQMRNGNMTEPETVSSEDNVLNLHFTETDAEGNVLEGGIEKDNSLLVKYFAQPVRGEWMGKQKGDSLVVQLSKAFDTREREWVLGDLGLPKNDAAAADKFFRLTITKLGFVEKAEMNEEFFKKAYPNKEIHSEEELKNTVRQEMEQAWERQSLNMLQHEVYHVLIDETRIDFPETFLKRWLQHGGDQPKTVEQVEEEYPHFINQLKWTLITDKIFRENNLQVTQEDIRNFAKQQLAGYMGMQALDESQTWISDYINRMMQDKKFTEDTYHRLQNERALEWAAAQVNAVEKPISIEEFQHLQHQHRH
ncbi:MAG TPA: trigger factor [Chitinophagaceae bacterium]|nr:trigger factor [Chitinophagaceae bacterium]